MPANPWELRADVRPLDAAATRWTEIGALMSRRGDEIVEAARRATEGWDAAAAESYEQHRRQVLANLDRFTGLVMQVAESLRAISAILTSSQKELDRAWTTVALVPHEVVGESRHLVFTPEDDEGRGKVDTGRAETDEIRRRLALSLDQESARLRTARAELGMVRTELTTLTGGTFGGLTGVGPAFGAGGEESGVGTFLPPSTSVLGSAQSGVAAAGLPPVASVPVSVPPLSGLSAAAVAPIGTTAAGGLTGRRSERRPSNGTTPPAGGMAAGAMGARAGTMSRGMASGRAGTRRLAAPPLDDGDGASAASRKQAEKQADKQAEKDAKRAALEEKRAERAARRAEREKDKEKEKEKRAKDPADETDETTAPGDETPGERPAAITVVHHAPGEEPEEPRR